MIELQRSKQAPAAFGLVGVAKMAGAVAFLGVVAAQVLATAAERGQLPHLAVVWPQDAARGKSATLVSTTIRSVGVDGVTTSTITTSKPPRVQAQALSPCGEADALRNGN
ncbi:MAG TPA: hypothetical protein VEH76_03990 [Methylocystis sp.]|nr:hypothetical protein [Methylocystis sp.]